MGRDTQKILVVDDSENHRTAVSRKLISMGYEVATASSGAQALQHILRESLDLILLDVVMPGLDGFGTLRQIRVRYSAQELPVIMLTARDDAEDVIRALRLGANDYAVKPIKTEEFEKRIKTHLKLKNTKNEKLGRYLLQKKLGEGAMGIVYQAEDPETNQILALKVLSRSLTIQEASVKRFIQEGEILGQAKHPNVVRFYEIGRDGDSYFIAMEMVGGANLDELLQKQGPYAPEKVLQIGKQVAYGLRHLNALGIIHRDIKPHNIMETESGLVKITDFGIARSLKQDARLTRQGMGLGSLVYASPEQIAGQASILSDMYSLGATLYEISTGELPFPKDASPEQILDMKIRGPQAMQDLHSNIPKALCKFVQRLLRANPQKRFATYEDLVHGIDQTLREIKK
ncbi:MAG: protein kinase [Myxococcota bacterium]|nr:protein kinase [Myxococcota bacterium]